MVAGEDDGQDFGLGEIGLAVGAAIHSGQFEGWQGGAQGQNGWQRFRGAPCGRHPGGKQQAKELFHPLKLRPKPPAARNLRGGKIGRAAPWPSRLNCLPVASSLKSAAQKRHFRSLGRSPLGQAACCKPEPCPRPWAQSRRLDLFAQAIRHSPFIPVRSGFVDFSKFVVIICCATPISAANAR